MAPSIGWDTSMRARKGGRRAMPASSTPRALARRWRPRLSSGRAGADSQKRDQAIPCSGRRAARTSHTESRNGAERGGRPSGQRIQSSPAEKAVEATTPPAATAMPRRVGVVCAERTSAVSAPLKAASTGSADPGRPPATPTSHQASAPPESASSPSTGEARSTAARSTAPESGFGT